LPRKEAAAHRVPQKGEGLKNHSVAGKVCTHLSPGGGMGCKKPYWKSLEEKLTEGAQGAQRHHKT